MEIIADKLWSPWLLGGFLSVGLYFSLRTGFFQLFGARVWMGAIGDTLTGRKGEKEGALTQFQATATALAATIGTGSIAGVATAIFYGGPGAVFWMWLSAFLGMMIGFVEKTLAIIYRKKERGEWHGGPMEYMEHGLGMRKLAVCYAAAVTAAALGGGGMVQSNSIASGLSSVFGWSRPVVGAVTVGVTGLVILGGIGRIGKVCEWVTPIMAVSFIAGGGIVLLHHRQAVLPALADIMKEAFAPRPAVGGGLGYGMMTAMRYGIARGVFTNEAGLGSSSMVHAQARVNDPVEQGIWGIFEVFFSTLVICTVSALVILTSGVYDKYKSLSYIKNETVEEEIAGVPMAVAAFDTVFGSWGGVFLAVCLVLFAFSSLLGWSYYGERGLAYLTGSEKGRGVFRLLFLGVIALGSVEELTVVWQMSDLCNAIMAIPNLAALVLLSPEVFKLWREKMIKTRGR